MSRSKRSFKNEESHYPPKIINAASRVFHIGNRVRTRLDGKWISGEVVEKHEMGRYCSPRLIIRTDERVSSHSDALLEGFGIWYDTDLSCHYDYDTPYGEILFEDERFPEGDEIFCRVCFLEMTEEEKTEWDSDYPF